ncbi:aminoglycoside phosphotransferase family protein [Paractinoplanes toevensis]|uniref:aminoglycoside phosphotransferase family protein n=1 Tax=Paractinoplanes toevensis TaxID=571911 RepID=UPI001BB34FC2|nr:aminoglycoside phosphotransferase family protein [Actinoplanes toevensis]
MEILQDGPHRRVVRIGDTVRRPLYPWSATIHDLLLFLERAGFPYSPRFLGLDEDGREVLTYLPGDSGPEGWSRVVTDEGLVAMARLLREYHDVVAAYRPTSTAWAAAVSSGGPGEIVCHGDFGPWNLVWRGNQPVGILDWDYAWPQPPRHDVAYALEYVAPFRSDEDCLRWLRYSSPPDRRRRMERFTRAYGREEVTAAAVVAQQETVLARVRRLAADGCQPQADWLAAGALDETVEHIRWSREFFGVG